MSATKSRYEEQRFFLTSESMRVMFCQQLCTACTRRRSTQQRCWNLRIYRVRNPSKLTRSAPFDVNMARTSWQRAQNGVTSPKGLLSFCSRSTILVRLDTNNQDSLRYKPGDHLGIFPGNHEDLVSALIDKLEDAPPVNQIVKVEFLEERNTALGG